MQFPINEKVVWQALTPGAERIHAMCQLKSELTELKLKLHYRSSKKIYQPKRILLFITNNIRLIAEAGYRLVEEERMSIVPTYAVGGGAEAVRIARRVQIYKISNALTETFGLKDRYMEDEEAKLAKKIAASAQKAEETPVKKEKKEKKDSEKKKKKKKREEEDGGEPDTEHKKKKNKKK